MLAGTDWGLTMARGPLRYISYKTGRLAWRISYGVGARITSRWRKWWQRFRNPNAVIRFGHDVIAGPGFNISAPWGGTLIVGNDVQFRRNTTFELYGPESKVIIGDGCRFTWDVVVQCGTSITFGNEVHLGQATMVVDGNHKYRDLGRPMLDQDFNYRPLVIDDEAAIHSKVTIINSIGKRAIIGANAVVTKEIPPYTVAAGVPATVIDYFGPAGEEPPGWQPKMRPIRARREVAD